MEFDDILAICLERLAKGEPVEACLQGFPDEAAAWSRCCVWPRSCATSRKPALSDEAFRRGRQAVADAAATRRTYALIHGPSDSAMTLVEASAPHAEPPAPPPAAAHVRLAHAGGHGHRRRLVGRGADGGEPVAEQSCPAVRCMRPSCSASRRKACSCAQWAMRPAGTRELVDRRLAELLALQSEGRPVPAGQVERLAGQVDTAVAASASLPRRRAGAAVCRTCNAASTRPG